MREDALVRRIHDLTKSYTFQEPLARYLKNYFSEHRNMGARDRRETREWMYNYYRLGNVLSNEDFNTRLCIANFLCSDKSYPSLEFLLSQSGTLDVSFVEKNLDEKINYVRSLFPAFNLEDIFPFPNEVSKRLNKQALLHSYFTQPFVWIRVRRKYLQDVKDELIEKSISFLETAEQPLALAFRNSSALNTLHAFEKGWFEIQDLNSQKTGNFFFAKEGEKWWDACAASGGKSLLLKDIEPGVDLLATDNRETILNNLRLRMARAGVGGFRVEVLDLLHENGLKTGALFDGIIADVPCSGSGTWTRTPENLKSFNSDLLSGHFVPLQRKIVSNLTVSLKKSGTLVYITCSIFEKENEGNIAFFEQKLGLRTEAFQYLEGSETGSDTLFVARLKKKA